MKKTGKRIAYLLVTCLLATCFSPAAVYADEIIPAGEVYEGTGPEYEIIPELIFTENGGDEEHAGIEDGDAPEETANDDFLTDNTDDEEPLEAGGYEMLSGSEGSEGNPETESNELLTESEEDEALADTAEEGAHGEDPEFELGYEVPLMTPKYAMRKSPGHEVLPATYNSFKGYYNSFEDGKLPKVRNQGSYGTCWAFASLGAVEADLIHDGTVRSPDLSVLQLAYYSANDYEDPKHCRTDPVKQTHPNWLDNGGHMIIAARMLSELVGAIPEKEAPYPGGGTPSFSPDISYLTLKDKVRVKNAYFINNSERDEVKKAIMEHGGVSASYYDNGVYYNKTANSYYCDREKHNHAVMLVGWDDTFTADNFPTISSPDQNPPKAKGAWLVRNSWGENGYGRSGYFWISYEDVSLKSTKTVVAFDAVTDTYDYCYAYDGYHIVTTTKALSKSETAVVTYPVCAKEKVRGVGFEIGTKNVKVKASVKNKSTGESVSTTFKTTYAGIYSVEFDNELDFPQDATAEVSLNFVSDSGDPVSLICENVEKDHPFGTKKYLYSGVCDKGFTCVNGDTEEYVGYDPKVRLYTDYIHVTGVKLSSSSGTVVQGSKLNLNATVLPNDAINKQIVWSSSNTGVATVSSSGVVTAVSPGEAVITVRSVDRGKTAACKVNVKPVPVSGVSLNRSTATVNVGSTVTLKATVNPKNALNKKVTWSSGDRTIATVSSSGKVKGKKAGSTVITVKTADGKKTAKCKVTVKAVKARKIRLDKTKATVYSGKKMQLKATVYPDDTTNKKVTWSTSKKSVATVTSKGVVKAVGKAGTATITAKTSNGKKVTCRITVKPIKVKKVKLKKTKVTVERGKTVTLKAVISPSDATNKGVKWKSRDKDIATVSSKGVVKGREKGETIITVTTKDGKKKAECTVTVK